MKESESAKERNLEQYAKLQRFLGFWLLQLNWIEHSSQLEFTIILIKLLSDTWQFYRPQSNWCFRLDVLPPKEATSSYFKCMITTSMYLER